MKSLLLSIIPLAVLLGMTTAKAEAWTCYRSLNGKSYPTKYTVFGKILLHGDGSYHSNILLDDNQLLISSTSFTGSNHRITKNGQLVEIEDLFSFFLIFDKTQNRLIKLDAASPIEMDMNATRLPEGKLESEPCVND